MSQASKHLEWCFNKAKKELDECKKQGKRPKHRGMVKITPNLDRAKNHLGKAEHNLKAINYLLKGNFEDVSISMVFYSMYHCFLAIAAKFGYESRNQACTIALIQNLKEEGKIDIDDKYINMLKYAEVETDDEENVIEMREEYTYGTELTVSNKDKMNSMVEDCRKLIDSARSIVLDKQP